MAHDNVSPGVGPDGTASRDYLDLQAAFSRLREDVRRAGAAVGPGNPAAQRLCGLIDQRLDGLQEQAAAIERKYYARSLITQGRRKPGEGE